MNHRLFPKIILRAHLVVSVWILAFAAAGNAASGQTGQATGDYFFGPSPSNEKQIEALLTPTATIIATKPGPQDGDPSGIVLLDEVVQYISKDGRTLHIHQVAYKALTDAGAKTLNEDVFGYRHKQQTFRLVRAETIQPDGRIDAVTREAVLVQSPQRQADYALYDDQAEVRVIYPNVKTGSITHAIFVTDDQVARMPGTYSYTFIWGSGWPTSLERLVVSLPKNLAAKLNTVTLGSGSPEPTRETLADGGMRLTWSKTAQSLRRREVARAPLSQNGPLVHLTTLDSWDKIATWFTGMVKDRDRLSPALTAQVEEWTKGLADRDAIIHVLFTKVANDVRYTGLDLGDSDYQPYPCEEVWTKRYGDCKDKASLLVSFLRAKGITAHVTLLNTYHVGRIDRRAPDYKVFTHAIVAVEDDHSGLRFYDPTITWAEPGMLSPGDADRDVLVIDGDHARWAHTPAQTAGTLTYDFDLKLDSSGALSGWLSLTAEGYYGAGQRERFRNLDSVERRRTMSDTVRGFYSGADVIDVTAPAPFVAGLPDTMKAYFVVSPQGGTLTLGFPQSPELFLDLGTSNERDSAYFLYQDDTVVNARIALPAGIAPKSLPPAYQVETPTGTAESRWTSAGGVLTARLRIQIHQPTIPASEFARFYQAMLSLHTWLNQPLSLSASTTSPAPASDKPAAELDLPLMPSGDGQIDLVDRLYPTDGDIARRRAALQRTLQYFPNDKNAIFRATTRLAWLDWNADKNQEAFDRLDALLKGYGHDVTPELYSWAETTEALALRDLKRTAEAETILLRIARDPRLSADRRAEAAVDAAHMLKTRAPDDAVTLLLETARLPSSWLPDIYSLLARLELQNNRADALREQLTQFVHSQPDAVEDVFKGIVKDTAQWNDPADGSAQATLLEMATTLLPRPGAGLKAALDEATTRQTTRLSFEKIRRELGESVKNPPLAAWYGNPSTTEFTTADQYKKAIQTAEDNKDGDRCTRLSVCALINLPPGADFSKKLWLAASNANWQEDLVGIAKPYPILPLLLDLCDQLPKTEDGYYEGRFQRGAWLARHKDYAAEHALYASLAADPKRSSDYNESTYGRLGGSCEHIGDYAGALAAYAELEKPGASSAKNADCLLHAVFINLQLGRQDEALRIIGLLEKASNDTLLKATGEYNMRELIALRRTGKAALFWSGQTRWWPRWQALEARLHLPPAGQETIVPVIPDLAYLGRMMGQAQRDKDTAAYLENYRRLISAARWLPSMAVEIAGLIDLTGRTLPADITDFRNLAIAALEVPAVAPDNMRLRQLHLAAQLQDAGRGKDALAVIAAFQSVPQPGDEITRAMHRVWGIAASISHLQLKEASAAIAADFDDPSIADSRAYSIELLANLYRAQHRIDDEAALLKRELASPFITADTNTTSRFNQRYEELGGSIRFAKEVATWLVTNPLPWYDFAAPANLQDPRLRNLDEVLKDPGRQFNAAETVKLNLLVAQDGDGAMEQQQTAFINAFEGLLRLTHSQKEADHLVATVIDDASLDESVRAAALWSAIIDAYIHDQTETYHRLRDKPLALKLGDARSKLLPSFTSYMDADKTSPAALTALADKTTARPEMAAIDVGVVQDIFAQLLRLGQTGAVRHIYEGVAQWNFASDVTTPRENIQLGFLKLITAAEALAPVHDALIRITLAHFPSPPAHAPAVAGDRRDLEALPKLSLQDTRDTALYLIGHRRFVRENFQFWHTFINALASDAKNKPLCFELIEAALAKAPDDETRAAVVMSLATAMDGDDDSVRKRITALFAPYDSPVEAPLTHERLGMLHISEALRLGQTINPDEAFDRLRDPNLDYMRASLSLRHYTQTHDLASLKRLINAMTVTRLLNPRLLKQTIPALDLLGMKSEATLARETARRELHAALLMAWADGDASEIDQALDLAEVLGDPAPFPPGWIDTVVAKSADPMDQGRIRMIAAWLRKDWVAAAHEASLELKTYPTYYRFNWYLGASQFRAGQTDAARQSLTTYVQYSRDEAEYPEAVAMLEKLQATSTSPAKPPL
ncbi:MAG TPA: DUF3857 domain-containing protein [Rariglobus sp.]|jgi:hypothetical protein|nr:DUF3857 domain-containing protein [Rariglobus sp.]